MPKKKFYSVDREGSVHENDKKVKLGILSEDVMSYYRNVSSSLEQGFDDDPDLKDEFLTNVYNTLRDEGVQVSQNQTVSRILEVLFSHSKPEHMQDLFCAFCGELTVVMFDRFASHVFQAMVQYLPAMYEESGGMEEEVIWRKSFHENVKLLCTFIESHLRDIMTHTYASHVLRSFLEALSGVHVKEDVVRSRVSRGQRRDTGNTKQAKNEASNFKALSNTFATSFKEITDKLIRLCNFEDHLADTNFCPVLQTVLLILQKLDPDGYQSLAGTIIDKTKLFHYNEDCGADDVASRLPDIVQNEVGSYVVELLLSLASGDRLQELYTNLFKKRIIYFAVHPIANYVLQKMLTSVEQTDMMEELLSDISPYLEDILAVNHIGIVTKLAEACRRMSSGQEVFLKALMAAFHCAEPEDKQKAVFPLLASLQTYETFYNNTEGEGEETETKGAPLLKTLNYHGSVLLQQLLQFDRTTVVSASMLELSAPELVGVCCDKCGSHVIDVFFSSRTVLEKFKVALVKKLQGSYISIACNRNGSRCLENIWKASSLKQRTIIAEDLSKSQERLEGDQWGRFLYRNFALFKFSQRRREWTDIQISSNKKKQLINNILEGTSSKKKNKGKKIYSDLQQNEQEPAQTELKKPTKETKDPQAKSTTAVSSKPTDNDQPSKTESEEVEHLEGEKKKKKRKRNKGKKRMVRGEEDGVSDTIESEDSNSKVKKGKKRKQAEADVESESSKIAMVDKKGEEVSSKKKKKRKESA